MVVAITVGAIVLLAARDAYQHRLREESRPIEQRIADVRHDAAFMVQQLEQILNRHGAERQEAVDWVPEALGFYRQLEALAACASFSADECLLLAEAATRYLEKK